MKKIKSHKIDNLIINYFLENIKLYIICFLVFTVGIIIGVVIVNNMQEQQAADVHTYINNTISTLKSDTNNSELNISNNKIFKKSFFKNSIIIFTIWILGLTLFGKYFMLIILLFLGVNFGFLNSCILNSIELKQAILLIISTLLLQNIIFIPTVFFLITQGIKDNNYNNTYNNNKNQNTKFTLLCFISLLVLIISSLIETYVSTGFIKSVIKYL